MRQRAILAVFLISALPALACAGAETEEQAAEGQMGSEMGETMSGAATVQLAALNNSGVMGTATVSHTAESLDVELEVSGLTEGQAYPAHIHRGSCQQGGPVAAPLSSVQAMSGGTGSATTTLALDALSASEAMGEGHMEGEGMMEEGEGMQEGEGMMEEGEGMMEEAHETMGGYYIQVHSPDGTPVACGDIDMGQSMM